MAGLGGDWLSWRYFNVSAVTGTVTKMRQKMGHIARLSLRNLTKYINLVLIVPHLLSQRGHSYMA